VRSARIKTLQLIFWALMGALTIGTLAFVVRLQPGAIGRVVAATRLIPPGRWLTIALGVGAFYLTDWLRFYVLLRLFDVRISPFFGLRLTAVSYFAASLTPWQELHLPAMVLLMTEAGISPSVATAVTAAKSLYTVFWICTTACLALALTPGFALPPAFRHWLPLYLAPVAAMVVGMALVAIFAERLHAAAERARLAPQPHWRRKLWAAVDHAAGALALIGRSRSRWHALCHLAALGLMASYAFIGHELGQGLGFELGYGRAFAVFSNGLMAAYLAPVPGSYGVGEGFTAWLLDPRLSPEALAAGVLSRVLCWHIMFVPGAIILVRTIRRHGYAAWKRLLWGATDADPPRAAPVIESGRAG
jgi:uncharacterized membrane protein YbhN (UPF0104 family)